MATKDNLTPFKNSIYSSLVKDSGATYNSLVTPEVMSFFTVAISVLFKEEFKTWAIPYSELKLLIASTWFFINAISGETTIAVPSNTNAGN